MRAIHPLRTDASFFDRCVGGTTGSSMAQKAIMCALLSLLVVAVFDPADQILHMKVPLFVTIWAFTAVSYLMEKCAAKVSLSLLIYVGCLSVLIPLSSILVYMVRNGSLVSFDGFQYFKAYLFLALCIPLSLKRLDIACLLSYILTAESLLILLIYVMISINPLLIETMFEFGDVYGVIAMGQRTYGNATFNAVDYVTSPLLVIPLSYFSFKCVVSKGGARLRYMLILAVNVAGMFLSGTRNNMLMSFVTPLLVLFWYSRKKLVFACAFLGLLVTLAYTNWGTIHEMLSLTEGSNAIKLQHLRDYGAILSDPTTLFIGQGLGADFNSTEYGYISVTELTYVDMLRNYGVLFTVPLLFLLLFPLGCLKRTSRRPEHYLYLGYASYLVLCIADPFLFSSSGMLFLSIVVATTFSAPLVPRVTSKLLNGS
jgi:hypothetical protein